MAVTARDKRQKVTVHKEHVRQFTFSDVGVLPDSVRMHPLEVQETFREAFNANLEAYGSVEYAMKAATKSMKTKIMLITRRRKERRDEITISDNVQLACDRLKSIVKRRVTVVMG